MNDNELTENQSIEKDYIILNKLIYKILINYVDVETIRSGIDNIVDIIFRILKILEFKIPKKIKLKFKHKYNWDFFIEKHLMKYPDSKSYINKILTENSFFTVNGYDIQLTNKGKQIQKELYPELKSKLRRFLKACNIENYQDYYKCLQDFEDRCQQIQFSTIKQYQLTDYEI